MFRLSFITVAVLVLTACTLPASSTSTLPRQSNLLTQIDLETLVIQPGDLPPMEATVEKIAPAAFSADSRPGIAVAFARLLKQDVYVLGGIYVDVYTDTADTKRAYDDEVQALQASSQNDYVSTTPPVGERALLQYSEKDNWVSVVIIRCHAYIWISLPASREATLAYAKRLDARLTPLVCP